MQNKKSVMAFSALQILIFHLWIFSANASEIEIFLKQIAYLGVDIFFFLSAYSLASRSVDNYKEFIYSRFKSVYLKFILFALIAFIHNKWTLTKLIKVILSIELFEKGGGTFLWFLPAIMCFYLLFPLFQKFDNKNRKLTLTVVSISWLIISCIITRYTGYKSMFIFWNRIPIFLIGYYMYSYKDKLNIKNKMILSIGLIIIGLYIAYKFGYKLKLQYPFVDMFYIMVIPLSIGLTLLVDFIPSNNKLISWVGNSTLELYAIQMIFGYDLCNIILIKTKNIMMTNVITLLSVLVISIIIHYIYQWIYKKIENFLKYKRELN